MIRKKTNILIVGQGIAGSCLALTCLKNNVSCLAVENPALNTNNTSSWIAAGIINPIVFKRLTKTWMADELLPVAKDFYRLFSDLWNQKLFNEIPILKLFSSFEEQNLWSEKSESPNFYSYLGEILSEKDLQVLGLQMKFGAGIVKQAGYLNLPLFLTETRNYLTNQDSFLPLCFQHHLLTYKENHWIYRNENTEIECEKIIFCEGYHIQQNPYFNYLPFSFVRGEVLETTLTSITWDYCVNKNIFLLPLGNNDFKLGATYDWENLNPLPTEKGKEELLQKLDFIKTPVITKHQSGIRPASKDRRPYLGEHPKHKNCFVFNGLGTKGVLLAPYFSEMLLKSILNQAPIQKDVAINRIEHK
jgi:glycine oxidase